MQYEVTKHCFAGRKGRVIERSPQSMATQKLLQKQLIVPVETKVVEPEETKAPKRRRRRKVENEPVFEQDSAGSQDDGADSEPG